MSALHAVIARQCDAVLACDAVSQSTKEWAKALRIKCGGGNPFASIFA